MHRDASKGPSTLSGDMLHVHIFLQSQKTTSSSSNTAIPLHDSNMPPPDFIMTLDSDDEGAPQSKKLAKDEDDGTLNPDFVFDLGDDSYADILANGATTEDLIKKGSKAVSIVF